jgi:peptidoglycan-associated lipoprotein
MNMAYGLIIIGLSNSCTSNKIKFNNVSIPTPSFKSSTITPPSDFEINASSDNGQTGELKSINFGFDSYGINIEARKTLIQNADFLKTHGNIFIRIEGHCDERGKSKINLALGQKRASVVRNQLLDLGINKERIEILSLGKSKPIMLGHDKIAWVKNRRANFIIISPLDYIKGIL